MQKKGLALVGCGTVGTGVANLLINQRQRISQHAGCELILKRIVVANLKKKRDVDLPDGLLTDDLQRIINDDSISIVAQLIGGIDPARETTIKLLESGKDVVSANKALLAEHGSELFETARKLDRTIAFEAAVCGGMPIVSTLSQCFSANQITSICGILNGTSNFIVTSMADGQANYQETLAQAQKLGFAEADPTFDVDGSDAAQKLAILVKLAFGIKVDWKAIPRRGIDSIELLDFRYANEMGYRIKLIAIAQLSESRLQLAVAPMLVKIGRPLAEVSGNFNAVNVVGDVVGPIFLQGQGAGQYPTASAVIADIVDTVVGRTKINFINQHISQWNSDGHLNSDVHLDDSGNIRGRFYLRFYAVDHPGVLATIAGILGKNDISIASVIQHDGKVPNSSVVPVVIMTHLAREDAAREAVDEIVNLDCVRSDYERFRIVE